MGIGEANVLIDFYVTNYGMESSSRVLTDFPSENDLQIN